MYGMVCRTSYNQIRAIICVDTVSVTIMQSCRCEPCCHRYMHISPHPLSLLFPFHGALTVSPRVPQRRHTECWTNIQENHRANQGEMCFLRQLWPLLLHPPPLHCRQPLQNLHRRRLDGDASVWHRGELWIQSERHQWWCEWGGTTVTLRAGGWEEFN